jgi:hypothetical protein
MSIKINSIQGISAMSANVFNRYSRSNPNTFRRNPLWTFTHTFQGTVAGYSIGTTTTSPTSPSVAIFDKFPFASDSNATNVGGSMSVIRGSASGQSSDVNGYISGGAVSPFAYSNVIEKFPFAVDGTKSTDVGDLTVARTSLTGQSSNVSGYASGGGFFPPTSFTSAGFRTTIEKFPFATDSNATNIGALTEARRFAAGQSSTVSGYTSGGQIFPPTPPEIYVNTIDKFPFATDAGATDVGDLTRLTQSNAGQSSDVSGYTSGGYGRLPPGTPRPSSPVSVRNIIDKFPFATNANATDVGDLTVARQSVAGQSSTVSGYSTGGYIPGSGSVNTIDKFPFATNANATDVGDLSSSRSGMIGLQD